jgi:hypothetical protein
LAQGLQSISGLNEGTDSKEQKELKELETYLSWHSASQSKKALLTPANLARINLASKEISRTDFSLALISDFTRAFRWFPTGIKESANRRRYKERYPILGAFIAAVSESGIHGDKACPVGANLLEVR